MPAPLFGGVSSRHYLHLIEQVAKAGAWAYDLQSGMLHWSDGMHHLMRTSSTYYTPTIESTFAFIVQEDRWILQDCLRGEANPGVKLLRVRLGDGGVRWHEHYLDLIKGADGAPVRVLGGVRDVTETRTLAALLAQRQRLFETVTDVAGGFVWRADRHGQVSADLAWCAFTGASLAQSEGDGWLDVVHPDDRSETYAAWRLAVETGAPFTADFRLRRCDGAYGAMEARAQPTRDADAMILEWVGFCRPLEPHPAKLTPMDMDAQIALKLRPRDLRAARAFLDWSVQDLARESGVSTATISRFEASTETLAAVRSGNRAKLLRALQTAGVRFETDKAGLTALRLG